MCFIKIVIFNIIMCNTPSGPQYCKIGKDENLINKTSINRMESVTNLIEGETFTRLFFSGDEHPLFTNETPKQVLKKGCEK